MLLNSSKLCVPTLMFVSNDKMFEPMVQNMDNWLLIHKNYMDNISNGKLIEIDASHYFYKPRI